MEKIQNEKFNNYICRNRKQINQINDQITVKLSIDFIRFSIQAYQFNNGNYLNLFNGIRRISVGTSKYSRIRSKNYNQKRTYSLRIGNKDYEVKAVMPHFNNACPILLTVHDADIPVLKYLEPLLNKLRYHISWIEYTMDFISNKTPEVYQFIKSHLLLKWPGKQYKSKTYETSFYKNDLRGSETKGLRCYQKNLQDTDGNTVKSVRIELLTKRKLLKKNGIETVADVLSSDSGIVNKYLTFKEFNYSLLKKRLKEIHYTNEEMEELVAIYEIGIENGYIDLANDSAKRMLIKNDSDTFLRRHSFDSVFNKNIKGLSFVNGDSFCFSNDVFKQ